MTRKRPPTPPPDEDEKKERVIHTRVPESLEAELRKRSQELGMSVSNLVRNVLGHAFGLVGDVVADGHAIARAARGGRDGRDKADARSAASAAVAPAPIDAPPDPKDVLAWQPIVLGKNAVCTRCNDLLPRGRDAAIGVAEHGAGRVIVCNTCLEELRK
ncbi:MAG TPA: hypothetical protein VIV11_35340 [Kofleriaceae bacterium]